MANNYILLQSIQLTATTASVTFSNIPQSGYTDLKVLTSTRMTASGYGTDMTIAFNGSTSNFEGRRIYGYSGSVYSDTQSNVSGLVVGTSATANTFSVNELYIPNYLSSNVKSYSIDAVSENNSATAYLLEISANRWLSTAAINSITFGVSSSSFAVGSSFSLYGIAATGTSPIGAPKASGGNTVISDGTYWYHAFLASGYFTPVASLTADVLVVAGGGAGGRLQGGGGGAGGLLAFTSQSLTATGYTVTVGAGGVTASGTGLSGNDSQFGALTLVKGGGGGGEYVNGLTGGSGGGASGASKTGGSPTSGQGNAGGNSGNDSGGGGGGAGAAGSNGASSTVAGAGGAGVNTYSSWASATSTGASGYFAGGGGGGVYVGGTGGAGGAGGGAAGVGSGSPSNATTNTGGGGGGGTAGSGGGGSYGGSGIVIIRYAV